MVLFSIHPLDINEVFLIGKDADIKECGDKWLLYKTTALKLIDKPSSYVYILDVYIHVK